MDSLILQTDAYKCTHWFQYPRNTQIVYSYMESRGGDYQRILWFGLQYYLKRYLAGTRVKREDIDYAEKFIGAVLGTEKLFNRAGWERIVEVHEGKLPLRVKALPEGLVVGPRVALMTIENTDEHLGNDFAAWLVNYVESILMKVWYPTTVASLTLDIKETIREFAERCGSEVSPFHLNDFGYRGASSHESAFVGGAAHLINFQGTDNLPAIQMLMDYYHATAIRGFSVVAMEHSTVTSWGRENEAKAYENCLKNCPGQTVSIVSDSYDIMNAVENIFGKQLKDAVLKRDGKLVIRPDSGNPAVVSCQVLKALWAQFPGGYTSTGHMKLDPKVGVIYGDGINAQSIRDILNAVVVENGFSTDNIVFGMGGGLLQEVNRDTLKFAIKCSAVKTDGSWRDVFKDPQGDRGKASKRGRLSTIWNGEKFETVTMLPDADAELDYLQPVFENGQILRETSIEDITALVNSPYPGSIPAILATH